MKFDFFTLGGSLFWEDVFFYQKWRIQRHCLTKSYRLLDSWDIRRQSGTFEDCQEAFIGYIKSYEIPKQKNKMVVLLHGYMNSKNIFKPLWRKLALTNTNVVALNYPSLFKNSLSSAYQILFFLNHMDNINEISFVTKGAGDLVLRQLLNLPQNELVFANKTRIRHIISINPITRSNFYCDFLANFKFTKWILGPMLWDMTDIKLRHIPSLPHMYSHLTIIGESIFKRLEQKISEFCRFNIEKQETIKDSIVCIANNGINPLDNEKIMNYTIKFLNNGKI